MRNIVIKKYNLVYVDCSDLIVNAYISIFKQFTDIEKIKDKDLKKLIFHYVVSGLLKRNRHRITRPVFFINKKFLLEFTDKRYMKCFIYIFKYIKQLLPVPFLLIDDSEIFSKDNGELKELNERITNHYIQNKKGTVKLRKYLESEEYYELIHALKDINNIRSLST